MRQKRIENEFEEYLHKYVHVICKNSIVLRLELAKISASWAFNRAKEIAKNKYKNAYNDASARMAYKIVELIEAEQKRLGL